MKLICVRLQHQDKLIYLKPDTCLIRNNEDFYLPEFSQQIEIRPAFIIKVKKIGKRISPRFAHRYYEEISAGFNLEDKAMLKKLSAAGLPWDSAVGFDRSAPLGAFINKSPQKELTYKLNEETISTINSEDLDIDQIISEVSHLFTLKIGDLIYISPCEDAYPGSFDQEFSAHTKEERLLRCRIK